MYELAPGLSLAELRPRLACFGHGFTVTDPGRFRAAVDRLEQPSA